MNNKEFSEKLESRTLDFALSVIKMSASLPYTVELKVIRNQITKAGTSIGANYREANKARSHADFINKIKICESEANEAVYWFDILSNLEFIENDQINALKKEAKEILAIFASIIITMKKKY